MQTENYGLIFPIGLRMDLILICYLLFAPVLLIVLLPEKWILKLQKSLNFYFIFFLATLLFFELATPDFIFEYDTRPNKLFLDYFIYPKEVLGTLLKGYLATIIITFVALGVFVFALLKYSKKLFSVQTSLYKVRLLYFPLIAFALFCGARSSLTSRRPINTSNAIFSVDQLTNCLALNSFYTVAFAAYSMKNESNYEKMYGKMDASEALSRVKKYMDAVPDEFADGTSTLHIQKADSAVEKPYNIVIILEESLGAEYVGSLGGLPLTPEFDKLTKEGMLYTKMYSTGTRSVRGIEAVVSGFLPSPSESVVKLPNSQENFYKIASLLKRKGYDTSFIYGGMANFDNMGSFFNGNGFDKIIDEDDYDKATSTFHGTWGWSDEDLMAKAIEYFSSLGSKPFVSVVFSSSNHDPFEFPDGRIKLFDKKKNTVNNAISYADYSIGKFFEMAKKEAYYKNTIFVIIADHNTRTYGKHLVPIHNFHIPALIIGPNIPIGKYEKLCSQIDIQPTVLGKIGIATETPMPGRNLFKLPETTTGRAIMQFHDINAFRVGDQVLIMQPYKKPLQFHVKADTIFTPEKVNEDLAKDALAHVGLASHAYKERKYSLRK